MKSRFCESNYWNVLEGFLSVLLKHQVHIQRLIRRKTIQQEESSLVNRIDILAIEDSRDPVLVRIQTFRELAYFHRLRYGTPCIAAETDVHVAKLYTINVMFLDIGHHKDYIYCGNQSLSGLHYPDDEIWSEGRYRTLFFDEEAEYTQYVHYLILVNEFDQVARTPLDEWIRFLKTGEIQGSDTAQGLPEARERLRIDSLNAEEKHAYIRDMEAIRYQKSVISTGWIEGREEGRAEEHLKVLQSARFMKSLGISVEDIKNNLGLTDEEINAL
jgi:hypothetical protein